MKKNEPMIEHQNHVLRAAVYIRIPSIEGCPKDFIRSQMERCRKFIIQKGWTIGDLYVAKEGNAVHHLLWSRAKAGYFDFVVVSTHSCSKSPAFHTRSLDILAILDARWFKEDTGTDQPLESETNRIDNISNGECRCRMNT
jgi:hypothetical protein